MAKGKTSKKVNPKPQEIVNSTIETFMKPSSYVNRMMIQEEPSCFNGEVRIRKYKVVQELIEEPIEVLQERLQNLWDHTTNHHNSGPLQKEAEVLGYKLQGPMGSKVPSKY